MGKGPERVAGWMTDLEPQGRYQVFRAIPP